MIIPIGYKDMLIPKGNTVSMMRMITDGTYNYGWNTYTTVNGFSYPGAIINAKTMVANNVVMESMVPSSVFYDPTFGLKLHYVTQHSQAGLYKNNVQVTLNNGVHGGSGGFPTTYTYPIFYYLFYEAVSVLKHNGVNVNVSPSVSYANAGTSNPVHTFYWGDSFAEVGSSYSISKETYTSNGTSINVVLQTAIVGVDYEIIQQSADTLQIKFLTDGRFVFEVKSEGYTSNNHPYPVISINPEFMNRDGSTEETRKVKNNKDTAFFIINVNPSGVIATQEYDYKITYPKLTPILNVVNPDYIKNLNPLTTYVLVNVAIYPDILYNTGGYERIDFLGNVDQLVMTQQQWDGSIKQNLKVDLYIKNSSLSIHDSFLNIDIDTPVVYNFYPDDDYEVYYEVKLK